MMHIYILPSDKIVTSMMVINIGYEYSYSTATCMVCLHAMLQVRYVVYIIRHTMLVCLN